MLPGYEDIDSSKACTAFQELLAETIDELRRLNEGCEIDLALAGGRKGMAALAMFVAQTKDIHNLYHTLILDRELDKQIDDETELIELQTNEPMRNERLFLRAYQGKGPYTKFVLFQVPVIPKDLL